MLYNFPEDKEPRKNSFNSTGVPGVANSAVRLIQQDMLSHVFHLENGKIRVSENSAILQAHFPGMAIVPGVILKRLLSQKLGIELYKNWNLQNQVQFNVAVRPGAIVRALSIGETGGETTPVITVENKGQQAVAVMVTKQLIDPDKYFIEQGSSVVTRAYEALPVNVSEHLLQAEPFRFVDCVGFHNLEGRLIQQSNDGTNLFYGRFAFPENFALSENKTIPYEIVEESVAQMGSVAMSIKQAASTPAKWKQGDTVVTFKESLVTQVGPKMKEGSVLVVVGKLEAVNPEYPNTRVFKYNAYDHRWEVVLRGQITGSAISRRVLERLLGVTA